MPYGRSNLPAYLAMRDLGNTLYSGLSDIGNRKIQAEDRGFNRMLQENQLGRQAEADTRAKEMYELQKPGAEVAFAENKAKLERLESPVTLGELAVDQYGLQLWTNVPKGDSKSLTEKFGEMFGAKYDTKADSPTRGQFVKSDGTPLKRKDMEPKWQEFNQLVTSNIDPEYALEDQVSRYQDKVNYLKSKGVDPNSPEMQKALKNLEVGTGVISDPAKRIKVLERQRDMISKFSNPDAKKMAERLDNKIDKIHEEMRQDKKTKEEQSFRAGESAKDRASREKEAELNRESNRQPKPREIGSTRSYEAGGEKITQEWDGFRWNTLGTAPRERPLTEDKLPYREKAKLDTLKEERKAYVKQIAENEMLTPEKKNELQGKIDEIDRLISGEAPEKPKGKKVVRTGTDKKTGRKVNQYDDGTVGYAD